MKKGFICFVLALALVSVLFQVSALADDRIVTSYDPDNYVEFTISGDTLNINGKLIMPGLKSLWFSCGESTIEDTKDGQPFSVRLPLDFEGTKPVTLYFATEESGSTYWSYIWNTITIENSDGQYGFMKSSVLDNNLALCSAYSDPAKYLDVSQVSKDIKDLSDKIVSGETDDYKKLFLLHKWVAENIYYDYDYYYGNSISSNIAEPNAVLQNRRSVCAGYAALLEQLIRAQGIPAMEATTFALGLGVNGGSFAVDEHADITASNHAHVEAYVDGRWVIMDPTWDSNNKYQNGEYDAQPANNFYYFDITPEALALNHKYISRGDGKMVISNGKVVGADPLPVLNALPTDSAVLVNGTEIKFDAYNINGNNYFKLRDLAYALDGSEKQFEVTWDDVREEIYLVSQSGYTPVGGELRQGTKEQREATLNTSVIYLDGCVEPLTAYTINGNNYFKLRDLGKAFDFDVTWDEADNTVIIDTTSSYTPD